LAAWGAKKTGRIERGVIVKVMVFVEASPVLNEIEKEEILDAPTDQIRE
jgi:hypothetical protein